MKFAMKLPRFARLLPGVMLATAVMLVLNGTGIVQGAAALAEEAANAVTAEPAAKPDLAEADTQIASAAQADVLTGLSRRRAELDARESQAKFQGDILAATEKRVDAKIAQLKALQDKIAALLTERDEAQNAQVAALVKTYSAMKPADAARIFDVLPEAVQVPVAQQMKSDVLSLVMARMSAEKARDLTVKLANRLVLPEATDAPAPVQTAAATPVTPVPTAPAAKP
jgi:flagellar motility protein MotE (MotC chaperone)